MIRRLMLAVVVLCLFPAAAAADPTAQAAATCSDYDNQAEASAQPTRETLMATGSTAKLSHVRA